MNMSMNSTDVSLCANCERHGHYSLRMDAEDAGGQYMGIDGVYEVPSTLPSPANELVHPLIPTPNIPQSECLQGSPIRRVPFDILREIAFYCVPIYPEPTFRRFQAPFSRVCSFWREVVMLSPQLWTTLCVKIGTPDSLKVAAVQEWFRRAGRLPVTLYIDIVKPRGRRRVFSRELHPDDLTAFFTSITPSLSHLSHLGIRASTYETLLSLLEPALQCGALDLKQLDIRTYYHGILSPKTTGLFSPSLPLTRLTLDTLPNMTEKNSGLDIPWSQLTYLRVGLVSLKDWMHVMDLSPNLQTASFTLMRAYPQPAELSSRSTHLHLENLSLKLTADCSNLALYDIMQVFQLPSLKILELTRDDVDLHLGGTSLVRPPEEHPSDIQFQQFDHLECLSINAHHDENIRPLLLSARRLRELTLFTRLAFPHKTIKDLSHPSGEEEHILPQLDFLRVMRAEPLNLEHRVSLIELLQAMRLGEGASTCSCHPKRRTVLNIQSTQPIPDLDEEAIRCRKYGLNVEIQYEHFDGTNTLHRIMPHVESFDDIHYSDD